MHHSNDLKTQPVLIDPFGRQISYLRLSVTDRCNFRCTYCMAENMTFVPKKEVLTLEEMVQIATAFTSLGVNKIRLTGGEPLVRKNILWLVKQLSGLEGLNELTLTTNGALLTPYAKSLCAAGINRLNISLDTLQEDKFRKIARIGSLSDVIKGIESAKQQPFSAIKLNSVIMRGINDDEILSLTEFAINNAIDISFIEEMPLGHISSHNRSDTILFSDHVRNTLEKKYTLAHNDYNTGGPSRYMTIENSHTRVGFISPHSNNFCSSCNRVRLTAEGKLLLCLGHENAIDLRAVVRSSDFCQEKLQQTIINAIKNKPEKHEFNPHQTHIVRFMNATGG